MKIPYIRIATSFYKVVEKPSVFGESTTILAPWNYETIKRDHGFDYEKKIPRYDGKVCFPDHINYKREIGEFYNVYNPLTHKPAEGSIDITLRFLEHFFGEQLELGLDYLQLLYTKPLQKLPVFCMVSAERNTGKSSFLKWLKHLFQKNATFLTNESFISQFNDDWVNCLIIMQDEVLFNIRDYTERIKNLSTTNSFKEEGKNKGRFEIDFFGKFILCSNNETSFIHIDQEETRFWVRKLEVLSGDKDDTNMIDKLVPEIPAFFNFLLNRQLVSKNETRMWFSTEEISTPALIRLKNACHPKLEKDMAYAAVDAMDYLEVNTIYLLPNDFVNLLSNRKKRSDPNEIREILKKKWGLEPTPNTRMYTRVVLHSDGTFFTKPQEKGRYYTVSRDFLMEKFDELKN